ncbi:hypothetical protein COY60_02100, partial [Candidatus Gracilibacteria bacterium CG_4_10_14_0_8_um_filter_38_28]
MENWKIFAGFVSRREKIFFSFIFASKNFWYFWLQKYKKIFNSLGSVFTTEAIVLKKIPIRDGEELHELFTKDFGKIRAWTKRKKQIASVDHGSIIH